MTTFQEQPLQSRRAARESERAESAPGAPSRPASGGEPLNYVTQNRPPLPGYDATPARGRRAADPLGTPQPASAPEAPAFRVRDYSPEGRRSAAPAWMPTEEVSDGGVVDYHTQARASVAPPVDAAPVSAPPLPSVGSPAPGSLAAALSQPGDPSEHTLTRRELRAIREAHGITAVPTDVHPVIPDAAASLPVAPPAPAVGSPLAAASPQLDSALAEFDALSTRQRSRGGRRAAPQPDADITNFEALFTPPSQLGAPASGAPASASAPASYVPEQVAYPPTVVDPSPVAVVPAAPVPVAQVPAAPAPVAPVTPVPPGERPAGHWTNQADLDDRTQVNESTISRRVGSGTLTTSALVLPSLPGADLSTGEILMTGSIELPRSMSSIGAHPSQVDESDLDHLLDPGDHQVVSTDSIPIRATRAVSSHTSTRGVITAVKPRGNRALTALIISAAGMAVVVVTLLVVALATNVL